MNGVKIGDLVVSNINQGQELPSEITQDEYEKMRSLPNGFKLGVVSSIHDDEGYLVVCFSPLLPISIAPNFERASVSGCCYTRVNYTELRLSILELQQTVKELSSNSFSPSSRQFVMTADVHVFETVHKPAGYERFSDAEIIRKVLLEGFGRKRDAEAMAAGCNSSNEQEKLDAIKGRRGQVLLKRFRFGREDGVIASLTCTEANYSRTFTSHEDLELWLSANVKAISKTLPMLEYCSLK